MPHTMRNLINLVEARSQAQTGGTIGVNGYFYKGGRFLPNTQAEPGTWKVGKKWIKSGRELIAPGEFGMQPTPFSRSLFMLLGVGHKTRLDDRGNITVNQQSDGSPILDNAYEPITVDSRIRPGVKGVLSTEDFTLGELIDLYMKGARWLDVKPDAETITT
jgi:hypothetical protein